MDPKRLQITLGALLRAGVILAACTVLTGAAIYLWRHGAEKPQFGTFRSESPGLRSVSGIVGGALAGRGRAIIQLGLLILIATPVARVAFSAYAFAREGDRKYVVITLIVLSLLCFSVFAG
ncbi:MAG TPA: DUF1634 domain-containing protein [Bryobacteraceae bacterium]|nr:DUF1634 domain-containing protein [Bryobacteraceae bacterium]